MGTAISLLSLKTLVFTKWLRPTHTSQNYAIRAQNSPNLPWAVRSLIIADVHCSEMVGSMGSDRQWGRTLVHLHMCASSPSMEWRFGLTDGWMVGWSGKGGLESISLSLFSHPLVSSRGRCWCLSLPKDSANMALCMSWKFFREFCGMVFC